MKELSYPFNHEYIIKNKRKIKKELLKKEKWIEKKIAILGGSTTNDFMQVLELFLLDNGIKPTFYESDYNSYYEDAVFGNENLDAFNPDIIYVFTTIKNVGVYPNVEMKEEQVNELLENEFNKYKMIWDSLIKKYNVPVIQNNFEWPPYRIMGNRDCYDIHGNVNFIARLNQKISEYAYQQSNLYINDINYISSCYGLDKWFNQKLWYMYKYAMDILAIPEIAFSASNIIKSIYGKNKKSIILDMDNTLWGGVIGDDGVKGIILGNDTAIGQAYLDFQKYIKLHKDYGIILNISSKNDYKNAIEGLNHPDSILHENDFVEIKANWDPKNVNISNIASELNLGTDSFIFIDDNPMERDIVSSTVKGVETPNIESVETYITTLDKNRYFEITSLSKEDSNKTKMYKENIERNKMINNTADYNEYLKSLQMVAIIKEFEEVYLERITQLANKSNQFNLTTKRYTISEIESIYKDNNYIKIYGKLNDKFGENGLVSVVIGKKSGDILDIELWIMSCRVLKRNLEDAMMNILIDKCRKSGIKTIHGYYYKTEKNGMVKDFYKNYGFKKVKEQNEDSVWNLEIKNYKKKTCFMDIVTDD